MGYIFHQSTPRPLGTRQWTRIGLFVFAANAPDLDFLPGLVFGDLPRFHHGPSHSIGLAILFGLIASLFFSRRGYAFVVGSSLYLSHVVLDYLGQDPTPPFGVPLFWPFSEEYFMAAFAFFRPFHNRGGSAELIVSVLFTFHNFLTVLAEIAFLLPLLILSRLWKKASAAAWRGALDDGFGR
jgi:inner membrane protein